MLIVAGWADADRARGDERKVIRYFLAEGAPLLNAEAETIKATAAMASSKISAYRQRAAMSAALIARRV